MCIHLSPNPEFANWIFDKRTAISPIKTNVERTKNNNERFKIDFLRVIISNTIKKKTESLRDTVFLKEFLLQ